MRKQVFEINCMCVEVPSLLEIVKPSYFLIIGGITCVNVGGLCKNYIIKHVMDFPPMNLAMPIIVQVDRVRVLFLPQNVT